MFKTFILASIYRFFYKYSNPLDSSLQPLYVFYSSFLNDLYLFIAVKYF